MFGVKYNTRRVSKPMATHHCPAEAAAASSSASASSSAGSTSRNPGWYVPLPSFHIKHPSRNRHHRQLRARQHCHLCPASHTLLSPATAASPHNSAGHGVQPGPRTRRPRPWGRVMPTINDAKWRLARSSTFDGGRQQEHIYDYCFCVLEGPGTRMGSAVYNRPARPIWAGRFAALICNVRCVLAAT